MKLIDKLFPKKFKVRIVHLIRGKYSIEWCHYRLFPIWYSLKFFFELGHPSTRTECWSEKLWDYQSAESIAKEIKSIRDIESYYKPHNAHHKAWIETEKEWQKNHIPYKKKLIRD